MGGLDMLGLRQAVFFILPQRDAAPRRYNRFSSAVGPGNPMSSAAAKKQRPKYLSLPAILFQIRLPLPGWVSILHRISGALLVFPFAAWALYLLDASLRSEQGFSRIREYMGMPLAKLGLVVFLWAGCHHFCAGIRYLALDLNKGIELRTARITSALVIVAGLVLTALFAVKLW
jgi:succinate dehydrogenase / fumarate reductase cytochrome b subunit